MDHELGDLLIWYEEDGDPENGVECMVVEVGDDGRITKLRAVHPDPALGKRGWFKEEGCCGEEEWVKLATEIITQN